MDHDAEEVAPRLPERSADPVPTGNAAFDAYRSDMLTRLEDERRAFEGFLGRLREARDSAEFDRFMDDRARVTRSDAISRHPD